MDRLLDGRYRLGERLGRGGMGTVWRAHDTVLDRDVAVKELNLAGLPDEEFAVLRSRMEQEARAAARIRHPGVVTVYDVLEQDGRPWIVMELIDGRSLADVVASDGPLPSRDVARIGAQVLSALERAHGAGVVHRDVKPANVLLEHGGRAVLTDFGIAALEGTTRFTRAGDVAGSPDYLAPEQITVRAPGPASDLWSLGATLYTAVEGRPPFGRPTAAGTLQAVVGEALPKPRRAGPLGPVIEALLQKDPQARPTAEQARRLLAAVASGVTAGTSHTTATHHPPTQVAAPDEGRSDRPAHHPPTTPSPSPVPVPVPTPPSPSPSPSTSTSTPTVPSTRLPPSTEPGERPPATIGAGGGEGEEAAADTGMGRREHGRGKPSGRWVTAVVLVLLLAAAWLMYGLLNDAGAVPLLIAWAVLIAAAVALLAAFHRAGQDRAAVAAGVALLAAGVGVYAWFQGAGKVPVVLAGAVCLLAAAWTAFLLRRGGLARAAVAAVLVPILSVGGLASALYGDFWYGTSVSGEPPAVSASATSPTPAPASPEASPAPYGYMWVDDPGGFRVAVPKDWPRSTADNGILYTPDQRQHLLGFTVSPGAGVVPGAHLLELERSNQSLPDYRRIVLTANTHQGGPGAQWEFTWTAETGPRHAIAQSYIAPNGKEYVIYVAYPEVDWPAGRQLFDSVLTTFSPR
ncbi:serine/threonine-protein kinase [Streptomyces wedmorensis]|uniref:serine/threonine-protein kinase n=1 Tax=Streptomyces wedmorensis TaxID=43759 RepID=UPI00343648CF